jgi:hypothetical protein
LNNIHDDFASLDNIIEDYKAQDIMNDVFNEKQSQYNILNIDESRRSNIEDHFRLNDSSVR